LAAEDAVCELFASTDRRFAQKYGELPTTTEVPTHQSLGTHLGIGMAVVLMGDGVFAYVTKGNRAEMAKELFDTVEQAECWCRYWIEKHLTHQ
jgi:hypothetical protein